MGKINCGRVILGGIVAGIVADVLGFLVDGVLLEPRWAAGMKALGHPAGISAAQITGYNVLGLVCGIAAIWIYAGIRPRFGAGVKTAVYAALVMWVVGALVPNLSFMYVSGLFGRRLTAYTTLAALVETLIAVIAGAALYKEEE
jgi:hypothetical protein